jgi:hypothetical protein
VVDTGVGWTWQRSGQAGKRERKGVRAGNTGWPLWEGALQQTMIVFTAVRTTSQNVCISYFCHGCYMSHPSHSHLFNHSDNINSVKRTNYDVSHCVIFSILLLFLLCQIQIFSSHLFSNILRPTLTSHWDQHLGNKCRSQVVSTPALQLRGPRFKSRPGDWIFYDVSWFSSVPPGNCWDSTLN